MSVDFEFRNKDNPLSYDGTPSYEQVKKVFKSGKIKGCKIDRIEIGRNGKESTFVVNCGGDCWLYVHNLSKGTFVTMPHFDHVERADQVLKQVAKIFNCTVLNDLEDSPYWSQKTYEKSKIPERSKFGISESSIRNVFGLSRSKKKSKTKVTLKKKGCGCK